MEACYITYRRLSQTLTAMQRRDSRRLSDCDDDYDGGDKWLPTANISVPYGID